MQCWGQSQIHFDSSAKGVAGKALAVASSLGMWAIFLWAVSSLTLRVFHVALNVPALGAIAILAGCVALVVLFNLDRMAGWEDADGNEIPEFEPTVTGSETRREQAAFPVASKVEDVSGTAPYAPFLS